MKITLVRHAEVIKEYQHRYNGHIDIALSEKGKLDAQELALKLKDTKFDKIYCSDLKRAKQTLLAFEFSSLPIFTKELREKSWGIHEGKSFEEIERSGIKYKSFQQWISALDGEDIDSYKERIKRYFYDTIFQQDCKNILIVTHSGVIKTVLGILNNLEIEESFSLRFPYSSYVTIDSKNYTLP
ncbi:MAG: histidine phosphatase family protein [Campylobacterota bacterium]|nr:histidine phosphatase family protein [Campylobacterota bacterium]